MRSRSFGSIGFKCWRIFVFSQTIRWRRRQNYVSEWTSMSGAVYLTVFVFLFHSGIFCLVGTFEVLSNQQRTWAELLPFVFGWYYLSFWKRVQCVHLCQWPKTDRTMMLCLGNSPDMLLRKKNKIIRNNTEKCRKSDFERMRLSVCTVHSCQPNRSCHSLGSDQIIRTESIMISPYDISSHEQRNHLLSIHLTLRQTYSQKKKYFVFSCG